MTTEDEAKIKQGSIAQFMRKRTQLVGFDMGYWKHVQYAAEFLDNALDAIEAYQWRQLKEDSKYQYSLDQEIYLENLSIIQEEKKDQNSQDLDKEAKDTLMQEVGIKPVDEEEAQKQPEKTEEGEGMVVEMQDEIEIEQEVENIIKDMESLIQPVENVNLIDKEPIVIIRMTESEAASFLTAEMSTKNVMSYKFEVFDNGAGMPEIDLEKFGKYLASSKSFQLKQTRGSQGFGAPSAFSDAQNTTGKPVVTVSKSLNQIYGIISEFFTTSKNEKKYLIPPTEIDAPFLHGTYVKLEFLNIKYVRGYVDTYVKETALMNPHVTLVYIDPYGDEYIFPRKTESFPDKPKYAKPHPSSTNIGDLQDLLAKSDNLTISAFLQDNFVRISNNTAKEILDLAERDLQDKLNFLLLDDGYIVKAEKKGEDIYYARVEKRVYGRSKRKRDKLIIYQVTSDSLLELYWETIDQYDKFNKEIDKIKEQIKKKNTKIEEADTKKAARKIRKKKKKLLKEIDGIRDKKDKLRADMNEIFKGLDEGIKEIKNKSEVNEISDLVSEVEITETRPQELSSDQFNSLFRAFKSVKYMSPPTDTVVPVGATILENTMIKELGLKVSDNTEDFGRPVEEVHPIEENILKFKKKKLKREDPNLTEDELGELSVDHGEIESLSTQILDSFYELENGAENGGKDFGSSLTYLMDSAEIEERENYKEVFQFFTETYTMDDDFVGGETRKPTSGKGLAFVVEGVLAYSKKNIETPNRSRDVLSRFVNRTPKLRDSADCAITKAVQSVNWKNYNLDSFDNGLPKGPIKLLVNVSGPFVHLMFKSQSKNSLAEDENLMSEIKYCLEAIGRRLRVYLNRRAEIKKKEKRANLIEKYIPKFVESIYNIAETGNSKFTEKFSEEDLKALMRKGIGGKSKPEKEEGLKKKTKEKVKRPKKKGKVDLDNLEDLTVKELRALGDKHDIRLKSRLRKDEIIEKIQKELGKPAKEEKEKKEAERKPKKEARKAKEAEEKEVKVDLDNLEDLTVKELRTLGDKHDIRLKSRLRKDEIIEKIQKELGKPAKEEKEKKKKRKREPVEVVPEEIKKAKDRLKRMKGKAPKEKPKKKPKKKEPIKPPKPSKTKQTKLPAITDEKILSVLNNEEWQTIKHLIFKLKIRDMMDARYLQIKLRELTRKGKALVDIKKGKKHWKLK
ncbi:MAG: DNA topoisomerase VI subunit B [Promethearchaeia archaeon]